MKRHKSDKGRREMFSMKFLLVLLLSSFVIGAITGAFRDGPQLDEMSAPSATPASAIPAISDKVYASLSNISAGLAEEITYQTDKLLYAAIPEPEPTAPIYDIKLPAELQRYTYDLCTQYSVNYEMVLAMMAVESSYRAEVISKTHDYGLMQINRGNHKWLKGELGISDFLDSEQNILAGIYMLSASAEKYDDPNMILMVYNLGPAGAKKLWNQGIYSTRYSRAVMSQAEGLSLVNQHG